VKLPDKPVASEQRRIEAIELLQQNILIVDVAVRASTSHVMRWRDA
jgi:hypothetical protein